MASLSSQQPSKMAMRTGGGSNTSRGNQNSAGKLLNLQDELQGGGMSICQEKTLICLEKYWGTT